MAKHNLKDLMAKRNPLTPREAITPANLYTSPQVDNTTSIQDVKDTSGQIAKPTTPQVVQTTSREVYKPTKTQTDKTTSRQVDKYTTHLRPETIKAVKRAAFESERKDYEIVQEALDKYFKSKRG